MSLSFTPGQVYEITLSNGQVIQLRFEGLGAFMNPVWVNPANGEPVQLPPFRSCKPVCK